jgi:hypothetical protein
MLDNDVWNRLLETVPEIKELKIEAQLSALRDQREDYANIASMLASEITAAKKATVHYYNLYKEQEHFREQIQKANEDLTLVQHKLKENETNFINELVTLKEKVLSCSSIEDLIKVKELILGQSNE